MYYPEELIEEIRLRNDIVNIISEYIQLNKKGSSHFGLCPFHNEKTPSFSVSADKQIYHCFGCGAGGNVYTFIMEMENYAFLEAVKHLADKANITLPTPELSEEAKKKLQHRQQLLEINRESAKYFYHQLYSNRGSAALQYLFNRKIEKDLYKRFGLGYSNITRHDLFKYLRSKNFDVEAISELGLIIPEKSGNGYFDRFWNRLMFPIFDVHNKVIGFGGRVLGDAEPKYLNSPESNIYNKRKHLYGLNIARTSKKSYALVVEGYMDVISLHQAGFDNAIAPLGTAFTPEQAMLLRRYFTDVVLAFDSDQAGIKATLRTIPILERNGLNVKVLTVVGYKDPDEFIKNKGSAAFEELVNKAVQGVLYDITMLRNQHDINQPDEKIKFIEAVTRRVLEIEDSVARDVYTEDIAKRFDISLNILKEQMKKVIQNTGIVNYSNKAKKEVKAKKEDQEDSTDKIQSSILSLIIQYPSFFNVIKEYVEVDEFISPFYRKAAEYVYKQHEKGNNIQLASIIALYDEVGEQNRITNVLNPTIKFESQLLEEKAINELVKALKQANIDYYSRTTTDINQLNKLIQMKRQLQSINISLNSKED